LEQKATHLANQVVVEIGVQAEALTIDPVRVFFQVFLSAILLQRGRCWRIPLSTGRRNFLFARLRDEMPARVSFAPRVLLP